MAKIQLLVKDASSQSTLVTAHGRFPWKKNQLFGGSPDDEVGEFIYCEKGTWKTRFIH